MTPISEYREIPLTQNQVAIVDSEDYDKVAQFRWFATWNIYTRSYYAVASDHTADGKRIHVFMHRLILGLRYGDKWRVDHIENGNTLDNRKQNLRKCTASQNAMNGRTHRDNKSGYRGVSWGGKREPMWIAQVCLNRKRVYRKGFKSKEDAAQVYALVAFVYHGEFCSVGKGLRS